MIPARRSDERHPLPALTRGRGRGILLLHGFGLAPGTYVRTAELLAPHGRVVVPSWLEVRPRWSAEATVRALEATIDLHAMAPALVIAHSFGGGLALSLAARSPHRVGGLVFCDSIGLRGRWELAGEALPGTPHVLRLATVRAAVDFLRNSVRRPVSLARAGWWGFDSEHRGEIRAVAGFGIPVHVVWASRDTLLSRKSGEAFAEALGATFRVVGTPHGPIDHDWMFRHPELFTETLEDLGVFGG